MEDQEKLKGIVRDSVHYSPKQQEDAIEEISDEAFLFDIAMTHVREHRRDEWIAETAVWRISDQELQKKIAVGAADYYASLEAVQCIKDDSLLKQVIAETAKRSEDWVSPKDLEADRSHHINNVREIAAEAIQDRSLLIDAVLAETAGRNEPPGDAGFRMIGMLCESEDLTRDYIERETNMAALLYLSSIVSEVSVLRKLKQRCDTLFADRFPYETSILEEKLAMAEHAESGWHKFEAMTDDEKNTELQRDVHYESRHHSGFDTVSIRIDEEEHSYEVSDIGSTEADFLELIDTLPENSFADLVWRGEPGRWDWFLARHNGLLYAEVPGFEKPLYRRYEDFRKQVGCVDVPMDIESRADSLKQWSD